VRPAAWCRTALAAVTIVALGAEPSAACATCFGLADGPLIDAARLGIWLLLGVTLLVQGGFVAFFIYLKRRAARAADEAIDQEWTRLQHEWDRSGGQTT